MDVIKKANGYRWWLGTWNNPKENYVDILKLSGAKYGRGQEEVGLEGTRHIQFVLFFSENNSLSKVKTLVPKEIHMDGKPGAAKKDICDYVWKNDATTVDGTRFEWGEAQTITKKSKEKFDEALERCKAQAVLEIDSEILVKNLMNVLKLEAIFAKPYASTQCRGIWYYGEPGAGKSHAARSLYGDSLYIKAQNKWWDGYRGERAVVLDDFDSGALGHLLKIWADKWSCSGEIKGGTVALQHHWFIITSNYKPEELWPEKILCMAIKRRFMFVYIRKLGSGERETHSGNDFGEYPGAMVERVEILPGMFL